MPISDKFEQFQTSLDNFRQVWTILDKVEQFTLTRKIKTNLFVFGQAGIEHVIKIECHSGSQICQFQTSLNNFRLVWTVLDKFRQVWTILDKFKQV